MPQAMFASLLCLFLAAGAAGSTDVKCEGPNCPPKPTPASLLSPTLVSPKRPASLVPPTVLTPKSPVTLSTPSTRTTRHTTPANHTSHHTTPHPTNHTTHHPSNHTTHHPSNHTTHHPSNHTTHHPSNHTTHHPANHTTHHPSNHTTHHPSNHTTHHPTPHPANHTSHPALPTTLHPAPAPKLQSGHYNVTANKTVCALADLKLQFRVQYKNTKKETSWGLFMLQPTRTHASGTCGTGFVNLTLTFPEGFLMFGFKKDIKKQTFYLSEVKSELMFRFPGTAGPSRYSAQNTSLAMLQAHLGHSYRCSNQSVEVKSTFWVDLVDQQVQSFDFDKNQHFGPAELCPQDKKLPVVAIVVAVVLVILILVVILVYVIGKSRSPAGYQSI
ncbi:macrosialin-like [Scyliorhinus torazame]|uniref:macrosialin-like n=1 Tax=Scyliorhinus torazame TaxID=75743 RepID=UPI003B59E3BA